MAGAEAHANVGAGSSNHGNLAGGPVYGLDARDLREEIRRIVVEELAQYAGGFRG